MKANWFQTLNEALESESLLDAWNTFSAPIQYGETRQWTWDDGSEYGTLISIYRNRNGMYERPIHYLR